MLTHSATPSTTLLVAALTLCQVIWGGYSVVGRAAVSKGVDPIVFAFMRDLIATPMLLLLSVLSGEHAVKPILPREEDAWTLLLYGVLMSGNQLFFILGAAYTTSVNASMLQPSTPVITVLLGVVLGLEALSLSTRSGKLKVAGIALAVLGAITAVRLSEPEDQDQPGQQDTILMGNLFLIINCTCDSFYLLLQKRLVDKYPPILLTSMAYAGSTLSLLVAIMVTHRFSLEQWHFSPVGLYSLAYAVCLNSLIVYSLISWCNKHSSPTLVSGFYPLQVIATAWISSLCCSSGMTRAEVLASVFVITGLFCVIASRVLPEPLHLPSPNNVSKSSL